MIGAWTGLIPAIPHGDGPPSPITTSRPNWNGEPWSANVSVVPLDHQVSRRALRDHTRRTVELIAAIDDPDRRVDGLDWSLRETATHLLIAVRGCTDSVRGDAARWRSHIPDTQVYRDRMTAVAASTLAAEPKRDPVALAGLLGEAVDEFLAASEGFRPNARITTPWYGDDLALPLNALTCLLLGEQVIHGYDLARTMRRRWIIERADALLALHGPMVMLPIAIDRAAAAGVRVVYAVHVRGAAPFVVRIHDGSATVEPLDGQSIDCHLGALDPAAFLLLGYGRVSQWSVIGRGRLFTWGRKPWLALRFKQLFFDP